MIENRIYGLWPICFYGGEGAMKVIGVESVPRGILCLMFAAGLLSCDFSFADPDHDEGTVQVRYNDRRQVIDGFGGSNAWTGLPSGAASREVVKLLYSKTEGAGFTILRNRIPFRERLSSDENPSHDDNFLRRNADNTYEFTESGGVKTFRLNWSNWDLANTKTLIQAIKNLGDSGPENLTLMSTPWTPPNNRVTNWKLNVPDPKKPDVGGRLDPARYGDYADLLADYVNGFASNMGVALTVLSVQNEPHWEPSYESCKWTPSEIRDFLIVLGQRFARKNVGKVGIMAPEDENFREDFITPSLNNAAAKAVLTHVGLHQYEGASDPSGLAGAEKLPRVSASGKRIWQTEVSGSGPMMPPGNGIDNALYYARMIHLDMTVAETNAFLFWWLWTNGDADPAGSLITVNDGVVNPAARLFAMGQYSRFIRPLWIRIGSTTSPASGVYSSAYRAPSPSKKIAVVLINESDFPRNISVNLEGAAGFATLDAWRTSATEKLEKVSGPDLTGNSAEINLPAKSITTLYGDISG
jgi:O-glycosyl hydrolase